MEREFKLLEALQHLVLTAERCANEGTDVRGSFAFTLAKEVIDSTERDHRQLLAEITRKVKPAPEIDLDMLFGGPRQFGEPPTPSDSEPVGIDGRDPRECEYVGHRFALRQTTGKETCIDCFQVDEDI